MNILLSAFSWNTVYDSLDILWKGVLSIAIVIAAIFLIVVLLNAAGNGARRRAERKAREESEVNGGDASDGADGQ